MRIEAQEEFRITMSRDEARKLRVFLRMAESHIYVPEDARALADTLATGIEQHLYPLPQWAGDKR